MYDLIGKLFRGVKTVPKPRKRLVGVCKRTKPELVGVYVHPVYGEFRITRIDLAQNTVLVEESLYSIKDEPASNVVFTYGGHRDITEDYGFELIPSRIKLHTVETSKVIVDTKIIDLGE